MGVFPLISGLDKRLKKPWNISCLFFDLFFLSSAFICQQLRLFLHAYKRLPSQKLNANVFTVLAR